MYITKKDKDKTMFLRRYSDNASVWTTEQEKAQNFKNKKQAQELAEKFGAALKLK